MLTLDATKPSNRFSLALLLLLVWRFPLLYLANFSMEWDITVWEISSAAYYCGSYLLVAALIYQNRDNLAKYHITPAALLLFAGAPFLALLIGNDHETYQGARAVIAAGLAVLLFTKGGYRFRYEKGALAKQKANIAFTILLCAALAIAIYAIRGFPVSDYAKSTPFLILWIRELSPEVMLDEIVLRGFLWGYLKGKGIREPWIFLIQAALYSISCFYYLDHLVGVAVVNPLVGLVLGLAVWKTRSVAHTAVLRASANALYFYLRSSPF